jgi:DNA-directed RNA polymerase subunit H (RpoH/RPB5)
MSNIPLNLKLYKSRNIILNQLERRGYNIDEYKNFSLNEIHVLNQNNQMDMLLSTENEQKCYVKYHLNGKLTKTNIYDYIEDLFNIENILTDEDDFIIIIKDKVNSTMTEFTKNLFHKENKFVSIYNIHRYLFNILEHVMVPHHKKLSLEEKVDLTKQFNILYDNQWPEIAVNDPVAQAIGLRPGYICEILRKSQTASITKYYRLCI